MICFWLECGEATCSLCGDLAMTSDGLRLARWTFVRRDLVWSGPLFAPNFGVWKAAVFDCSLEDRPHRELRLRIRAASDRGNVEESLYATNRAKGNV